jgi:molybdenum cofactor synthesis domain-containing protein
MPIKTGIITCSDKCSKGERKDTSGPAIKELLEKAGGFEVAGYEILPDEKVLIAKKMREWADGGVGSHGADSADAGGLDLIVTTGGTGLGSRDRTPEATREIIYFEIPGISELARFEGYKKTPFAVLSRAVCGARGKTLIINLPGSEKAVRETLGIILPLIPHAVELLAGKTEHGAEHKKNIKE